ncbi:MAG: DNA polymerase/3'-5' exonuclease PolX [Candidatus Omnitrophota bacterium]|nr:DNA polymerase/3'-5' exonuclease PolX [Candidatus Omnitrophota bacterium]
MTNKEIAAVFSRIADILEVKEENIFRVRAYRTAAQNITGLSRQLEDICGEDPSTIGNIPGIGKDLKEKIIEMIGTGRLKYFDDLLKEFSPGFLEMLDLSGLGPKKLKKLRDVLGIENVDGLEEACRKGKLEDIEGMGKKTQEKLLDAIEHYRRKEGRMLLPEASECAEKIIAYLSGSKNFKKIEKAGSLRRGKETVGDLDILTVAKDNEKAMDHFVEFPEVGNIIAKGTTKSSISLKGGPQVDLRVIDASCFGAALVYFTGSKQHNIKIRKIARNMGYKISEYGVFSVSKTGGKEKKVAGRSEEDLYRKLGMEWIPPELREDQGEVEAAMEGKLPAGLLDIRHIKGDLHMHTSATDGRNSVEEMVEAAREKGYKYVAITEHSKNVRVANGMDERRLLKHVENIRKYAGKKRDIKVLAGIEVDILGDGKLDLKDPVLKELDIVIAAIHSRFSLEKDKQTERILRAMDNGYVNVLAHPSGRLITTRSPLQADFDRIFSRAAESNIYLEINTHGERIDLNDVHCRRAKELGAKFVVNTDAHEAGQLDEMIFGVVTARRGWVEKKDVLNTYGYEKMIKALKR